MFNNKNIALTYDFLELYIVCNDIGKKWIGEDMVGNYEDKGYNFIFEELKENYLEKYNIDKLEYELNK